MAVYGEIRPDGRGGCDRKIRDDQASGNVLPVGTGLAPI